MEDLWKVQNSTIDVEAFVEIVKHRRFLEHFCKDEEKRNLSRLLYGDANKQD